MTEQQLWHENNRGQLVKCPAKIKCRLGSQHYPGATKNEAEIVREKYLLESNSLMSHPLSQPKSFWEKTGESTTLQKQQDKNGKSLLQLAKENREAVDPEWYYVDGHHLNQFEVEDEEKMTLFTKGNCRTFAEELQKKIGGEIVGVGLNPEWHSFSQFTHAYVHKNGFYYDVAGVRREKEIIDAYDFGNIEPNLLNSYEEDFGLFPLQKWDDNAEEEEDEILKLNGRLHGESVREDARMIIEEIFSRAKILG